MNSKKLLSLFILISLSAQVRADFGSWVTRNAWTIGGLCSAAGAIAAPFLFKKLELAEKVQEKRAALTTDIDNLETIQKKIQLGSTPSNKKETQLATNDVISDEEMDTILDIERRHSKLLLLNKAGIFNSSNYLFGANINVKYLQDSLDKEAKQQAAAAVNNTKQLLTEAQEKLNKKRTACYNTLSKAEKILRAERFRQRVNGFMLRATPWILGATAGFFFYKGYRQS